MISPKAWLREQLRPQQAVAWDEGFDYAWNLAIKYAGPIEYPATPGEGYDANPYRDGRTGDGLTGIGIRVSDGSLTLRHLRIVMRDARRWPDDSIVRTEDNGVHIKKGESR